MTRSISISIVSLACVAAFVAGCDSREPQAPAQPDGNASAPREANSNTPAESIIRPSVLAETAEPPAPRPERIEATLDFSASRGEIPAAAARKLDEMLKQPIGPSGGCIVVRGHTDSRGSDVQNVEMSRKRAEQVADYLADRGVARERIRIVALGERRQVAPNALPDGSDFPEGRAKNRRVDVTFELPEGAAKQGCSAAQL